MHKIEAEVILYDNVEELEFCTEHPYWISINGYVIKIDKKICQELKRMHNIFDLSTTEKTILYNIDKKYKYIAKDSNGDICVYVTRPYKKESIWNTHNDFTKLPYSKLFKFIKWDNPCPYVIKELLEVNHEQ